jgi:hypothetical protein
MGREWLGTQSCSLLIGWEKPRRAGRPAYNAAALRTFYVYAPDKVCL